VQKVECLKLEALGCVSVKHAKTTHSSLRRNDLDAKEKKKKKEKEKKKNGDFTDDAGQGGGNGGRRVVGVVVERWHLAAS
jgi:hypothetical protein